MAVIRQDNIFGGDIYLPARDREGDEGLEQSRQKIERSPLGQITYGYSMLQTTLLLKRLLLQREYPNYVRNWPLASTTPQIITSSSYSMDVSRTNNWTCTGFCRSKMRVKRSNPDCTITMNSGHTVNRAEFKLPPRVGHNLGGFGLTPPALFMPRSIPVPDFYQAMSTWRGCLREHLLPWNTLSYGAIHYLFSSEHGHWSHMLARWRPRNKSIHILYNHPFPSTKRIPPAALILNGTDKQRYIKRLQQG